MIIYISHSAGVAAAPKMSDPEDAMWHALRTPHGKPWFVVEPFGDEQFRDRLVESLLAAGRTVIKLDVDANQGLMDLSEVSK